MWGVSDGYKCFKDFLGQLTRSFSCPEGLVADIPHQGNLTKILAGRGGGGVV